jgi:hypothetical protein
MDIDGTDLLLVDPIEYKTLNRQPINQIRVWGVGRDNARYVSSNATSIIKAFL